MPPALHTLPPDTHRRTSGAPLLIAGTFLMLSCNPASMREGIERTPLAPGIPPSPDSVTVIPGPEYEAGGVHRFLFGDRYRDVWTAPVRAARLDLARVAGGLTPVEAGGGFQTKSLRFKGANGAVYKFRSVNKDPTRILPLELQKTLAADLTRDYVSTSLPSAPLIVDEIAGAVGVPRTHPRLVYLPDDSLLGEFRSDFGGLLGILEDYPADGFLGSSRVIHTLKMFEAMEGDSRDRPDAAAFLNARLLDILVGNWDRHAKQWRWAEVSPQPARRWLPVSLDHDQAFVRFDGPATSLAEMSVSQFHGFDESIGNVSKLTFSGRYLDRRILPALGRREWDSVTCRFVAALTDSAIGAAVNALPPEHHAQVGEEIRSALLRRRDDLPSISRKYYRLVSDYVDIYLSNEREVVAIERHPDGTVAVTAWLRDRNSGEPKGLPVYARRFEPSDTKEIRVYALGGDDRVIVRGETEESITVRIVGGKGDDDFEDTSVVRGPALGFISFIPSTATATYFYDDGGDNRFTRGPGTCVDTDAFIPPPGGTPQY